MTVAVVSITTQPPPSAAFSHQCVLFPNRDGATQATRNATCVRPHFWTVDKGPHSLSNESEGTASAEMDWENKLAQSSGVAFLSECSTRSCVKLCHSSNPSLSITSNTIRSKSGSWRPWFCQDCCLVAWNPWVCQGLVACHVVGGQCRWHLSSQPNCGLLFPCHGNDHSRTQC